MSIQEESLPRQKTKSTLLTTGLALFSMFFGAGNLIFPLLIGKSVGHNIWYAILGLSLTAVVVPFLGLGVMLLFDADYYRFFGRIGRIPGKVLLLLLQLILGPLGVIPRLITLMHATAQPYIFGMPLLVFSILIAALIFGCAFKRHRLLAFLGAYLTPLLLLSLGALLFFAFKEESVLNPAPLSAGSSFLEGLFGGYNTMDLIAAFLFATLVLPHFKKETELEHPTERRSSLLKKMFFSSLIAASLLFLTYVALSLISFHHGAGLDPLCPPEQMLHAIALKLLGPIGGSIAAITVMIACLTTAVTLVSIFSDYLRKDLCKEKVTFLSSLLITLLVTTLFANLGFRAITQFLAPILQIVYPALILLTLLNLLHALYGYHRVKIPVLLAFLGATIVYFFVF